MPTYNHNKFEIQVVDESSLDGFSTDGVVSTGCLVFVYDAGTKTNSTIYSDTAGTAKTAPISRSQFATDGKITFYGPNSTYDLAIHHSDGSATFKTVTPQTHTIKLNRDGADRCLVFPMVFNAGGTETDTGLDLPYKAHVYDVAVEVVTADATETVDIGLLSSETAGDADGFVAAMSVASTGFIKPAVITTGSNSAYVSSAKFGVLMGPAQVGTDVDQDEGVARGWGHVTDGSNAVSVSYTPSSSDTFVGYGYIYFKRLR